jgi:hypothetical protein
MAKRISLQDIILPSEKYWRLSESWTGSKKPVRIVALSIVGFRIIDPLTLTVLYEIPLIHIKTYAHGVDVLKLVYSQADGREVEVEFKPKKSTLHNMLNFSTKLPIVVWMESLIQQIVQESNSQSSNVSTPRSIRLPDEDSASESIQSPRNQKYNTKGYKLL